MWCRFGGNESTGVYLIPPFALLEALGFTVLLVNARHVKNVSGRKSDVLVCRQFGGFKQGPLIFLD